MSKTGWVRGKTKDESGEQTGMSFLIKEVNTFMDNFQIGCYG